MGSSADPPRPRVAVLVPAAGSGLRLGGARKQFRLLGGRPLLVRTLDVFEEHPLVDALIVAVPADAVEATRAGLREVGLRKVHAVVAGGGTRQASVGLALAAAPPETDVALVHDAVRPFVEPEHVTAVIEAVGRDGAAALAVPLADTLRRVEDGRFAETLAREGLYRMQTPQGFRADWLREAHARAEAEGHVATDDVALVQMLGRPVVVVPGSARNFKVTTPADWMLAQRLYETDP